MLKAINYNMISHRRRSSCEFKWNFTLPGKFFLHGLSVSFETSSWHPRRNITQKWEVVDNPFGRPRRYKCFQCRLHKFDEWIPLRCNVVPVDYRKDNRSGIAYYSRASVKQKTNIWDVLTCEYENRNLLACGGVRTSYRAFS